jgi:integrase
VAITAYYIIDRRQESVPPTSNLKFRRRAKRKVEPWSTREAQQYLQHAREKDDALYAAWVLAVVMAMRRGEILGLTWDAIDLDAGKLRSQDQLQRVGAELLHRETKTEDADDFLPLPPIVVTALRIRKAQQQADARALGDRWLNKLNLVFTTKYGTPYEPSNVTRMFEARCKAASVRIIRMHDARHTSASLLVELGVHPRIAMRILRHSKINVTMEVYSHPTDEQVRQALEKLADAIFM